MIHLNRWIGKPMHAVVFTDCYTRANAHVCLYAGISGLHLSLKLRRMSKQRLQSSWTILCLLSVCNDVYEM
jgi:hypothetical protein